MSRFTKPPSFMAGIASLDTDAEDLCMLAKMAELPPPSLNDMVDEATLEKASLELRRQWLHRAHRPGDTTLKSPCDGSTAQLAGGGALCFGYERELDAAPLETRSPPEEPPPDGWRSARLLLRSGQAALSCLLQLVLSFSEDGRRLRAHHSGRYFETSSLLGLLPRQMIEIPARAPAAVDLLVAEPVFCDGQFGITDPSNLPRTKHALLIDTTLQDVEGDLEPWLARVEGPLVATFRSGLKLDQAGLELANVGIVRLYVRDGERLSLEAALERLRRIRTLTGSGLTLDEMSALSAPWFLDAPYRRHYISRVFSHNTVLAEAIGGEQSTFEPALHPSRLPGEHAGGPTRLAPFCAMRLRDEDVTTQRKFLTWLDGEIHRRGLAIVKGGSFGLRSPRYELIEPTSAQGKPFVRIALGFRGGASTAGLIELLEEVALTPGILAK